MVKSFKILVSPEKKTATNILPSDDDILRLHFTTSEIISGFEISDIVVNGGVISELNGGEMNYSAIFIPSEPGKKDFELAAGSFADVAGNTNDFISFSSTYVPSIGSEYGGGLIAYLFMYLFWSKKKIQRKRIITNKKVPEEKNQY